MTGQSALTIAMAQKSQLAIGEPFSVFADDVRHIASLRDENDNKPELIVFPEMHLFGTGDLDEEHAYLAQCDVASDMHDELMDNFGHLAKELGIWLIPGTIPERNAEGGIFNTAPVFSPEGELIASYRKICPWRPFERYTPGNSFTVFDIPGKGRVGIMICYDAWFPEISRQISWLGADLIVNPVFTTTPDRKQELVLAQANAIVNQIFVANLNAPAPQGAGQSLLVDPEGEVIARTDNAEERVMVVTVDLQRVSAVRGEGTAGSNKMWEQFRPGDAPVPLPLYQGSIDSDRWHIQG
ncbi:carbon-nitrogen hydrolase family protein [Bifidobacterium moukalabense]|uniref:carbon-nitrogen hydrolase family protein n=1 Tax=Bifidobacterium moukalabense TaxID=1333651 RepID=UPI0014852CE4|nr:carbon-nitrogen hydrolase family protein [Bifidobacterium moukalabense]